MLEIAKSILENRYLCDNCLGRQFGQLLSGMTNAERGRSIRTVLAFEYSAKPFKIDTSNFHGFNFRSKKKQPEKKTCSLCNDFFKTMDILLAKAADKIKNIEYKTFVIGTRLSSDLIGKEESLWESVGIEYCEPIKSEINREFGKLFSKN